MILKGIKLEGRVRIYMITLVFFIGSMGVWSLPNNVLKLAGIVLLFVTYVYTTSTVGKKFAFKKREKILNKTVRRYNKND